MKKCIRKPLAASLAAMLLSLGAPAYAAKPKSTPPPLRMEQMDITAVSTEYDGNAHTYMVRGDVHVSLRDLSVTCAEATIYVTPKEDRVERIVFRGNVEAKRGSGTFRGNQVTYYASQRRFVAEGRTRTRLMLSATEPSTPSSK